MAVFLIQIGHHFNFLMPAAPAFQRQILVADLVLPFKLPEHFFARDFILEQADFKQLFANQLAVRVAQQLGHEGIGVGDFAGAGVEQEDAVMRRFK